MSASSPAAGPTLWLLRHAPVLAAPGLCYGRTDLPADPAAIRAGRHDGDRALYDRLLALAELRAWVADPGPAPAPTPTDPGQGLAGLMVPQQGTQP